MAKNTSLTINNDANELRIKSLVDLIVCEVVSISLALLIDTLVFSGYFTSQALPVIFTCVFSIYTTDCLN